MKLAVAIICFCFAGCEGLRVFPTSQTQKSAFDLSKCPDITDTDSVFFWGMLLDGKDHAQGKGAYDWHDFKRAYKSMSYILTEKPDEEIKFDLLMKTRKICCAPEKLTGTNQASFDWAGEIQGNYEGPVFHQYSCLECQHLKQIIAETPKAYMHVKKGKNSFAKEKHATANVCPDIASVNLKTKSVEKTQDLFKQLIHEYNSDIKTKVTREDKLARLATYLKEFAFLHPWGNGNGRFRTMMMNREVRRLGLGCGAMMYNNNKDLYYLTKETYIAKLNEGLSMYEQAMETGTSPWVNEDVVAKHKETFNPEITMPGLLACRAANWAKGSVE